MPSHYVKVPAVDKGALLRVVELRALDDHRVCRQVDAPRQRRRAHEHVDVPLAELPGREVPVGGGCMAVAPWRFRGSSVVVARWLHGGYVVVAHTWRSIRFLSERSMPAWCTPKPEANISRTSAERDLLT